MLDRDGRILDASEAAAERLGREVNELLVIGADEIDVRFSAEETRRRIASTVATGTGRLDVRHRSNDGTLVALEFRCYLLEDDEHIVAMVELPESADSRRQRHRLSRLLAERSAQLELAVDALARETRARVAAENERDKNR